MTRSGVFLCFGQTNECPNCGGDNRAWLDTSITTGRPGPDGRRLPDTITINRAAGSGPFHAPDGTSQCCSGDCWEEMQEFIARAKAEAVTDWCPACGYDNHEHAPDCATLGGVR